MDTNDLVPPFLVLAHHRSGSNFLNDLVQAHPRVDCINEPFSMHTPFFRDHDLAPWTGADYDGCRLHPSLAPHGALRTFLSDLRRHLLQSSRQRTLGFKETGLFGKLGWVQAYMPSLRLVFVKRDPRAIVSSVLRSGLMDLWRYRQLVPPAFMSLCPGYRSIATGAERDAELAAMSVAVRYVLAQRSLAMFRHYTFWLEDFMHRPRHHLHELCDFLGIEVHADQLDFLHQRQRITRGGLYSSFRARHDVQEAWREHLGARQIAVVDAVLEAAGQAAGDRDR
jgi:hypothetical protein